MKKVVLILSRLPNHPHVIEPEALEILKPILLAYGEVEYRGSWIMTCTPYGTGFFYRFVISFESNNTLVSLMRLCEQPICGFVGIVISDNYKNFPMPLMITGTAIDDILTGLGETVDITDIEDAKNELSEMREQLMFLEFENLVMREMLGIKDGESPLR